MLSRIWAPWRAQYIHEAAATPEPRPGCFLCRAGTSSEDRQNLVVDRTTNSIVVLNRYPYNNGHLLVAPRVHQGLLAELEGPDLIEPIQTLRRMTTILDRMLQPQGYNIGLNQGALRVPVCPAISTGMSYRDGTETPISCPSWVIPKSLWKAYTSFTTDCWRHWPTNPEHGISPNVRLNCVNP